MASTCKGNCTQYKAKKPIDGRRYAAGQKFCETCHIYINWEGLWCPCCCRRLRFNPRKSEAKEAVKEIKEMAVLSA